MSSSMFVRRSAVRAVAAAVAVSVVALTGLAVPAQAAPKPAPGKSCAMSGMVSANASRTLVCSTGKSGKLVWGKPLSVKAGVVTISDGWVKQADAMMTGAFGVLSNPTDAPIRVVAASSPFAKVVQTHEMVMKDGAMVMSEKAGGFVIPAKGSLELKPGGNHLMLMGLKKPVPAGAMIPITLYTADGGRVKVKVLGKVFAGANEEYEPGSDMHSGSGMGSGSGMSGSGMGSGSGMSGSGMSSGSAS